MKLRKAEEAELTSANVEVVGFAEKAVDASAGLPEGWAAAVDSDGDTYYVRSQPCHLPRRCPPPPELGPASSRCAVEQGDGRDAVGGPSVRPLSRDVCPPARRASWASRPRPDRARARSRVLVLCGWSVSLFTVECVTVYPLPFFTFAHVLTIDLFVLCLCGVCGCLSAGRGRAVDF